MLLMCEHLGTLLYIKELHLWLFSEIYLLPELLFSQEGRDANNSGALALVYERLCLLHHRQNTRYA